jgi:hypothetical protein
MARGFCGKALDMPGKQIRFGRETWNALDLLARDTAFRPDSSAASHDSVDPCVAKPHSARTFKLGLEGPPSGQRSIP